MLKSQKCQQELSSALVESRACAANHLASMHKCWTSSHRVPKHAWQSDGAVVPAGRWQNMRIIVGALPGLFATFESFGPSLSAVLPTGGRICNLFCACLEPLALVHEILPAHTCNPCDVAQTVTVIPARSWNHLRLLVRSLPCGVVVAQNSLRHPQKFLCAGGITNTSW